MPTTKSRLNITLPKPIEEWLTESAKAHDVPKATRALELLKIALEIEEDHLLGEMIKERDVPGIKWLTHEEVFGKKPKKI